MVQANHRPVYSVIIDGEHRLFILTTILLVKPRNSKFINLSLLVLFFEAQSTENHLRMG